MSSWTYCADMIANKKEDIRLDCTNETEFRPEDYDVLVVDDNVSNLKLTHVLLTQQGYRVRLAKSGQMALSSVRSSPPDMILLDITMPEMDGFEVCEQLKAMSSVTHVPIVFLSALKDDFDIVRGLKLGGVDFVTKPFKPEILLARMETHLTVRRLQQHLQSVNERLEERVEERTEKILLTNKALRSEMKERLMIQDRLNESEEMHRLTLANLDDVAIFVIDKNNAVQYLSPGVEKLFLMPREEVCESDISSLLGLNSIDSSIPKVDDSLQIFETEIIRKDGISRFLQVSVKEAVINQEVIIYTCRDITERKQAEQALADNEARLEYAMNASNEGIWDWDIATGTLYFNDTWFTMLGYRSDELAHTRETWLSLLHPEDKASYLNGFQEFLQGSLSSFELDYRLKKKEGEYCWIRNKAKPVCLDENGKASRIVGTHTDITKDKNANEELKKIASFDSLTKLPNRVTFAEFLSQAISHGKRQGSRHALLFIDLDRFKNVNDSLGHSAGDQLLLQVSKRLTDIVRGEDVVSRQGGDEFTLLLQDVKSIHKVNEVSNRIIHALSEPFDVLNHQVVITPSIGAALFPDHADNPEDLMKQADTAMYQAKKSGGNSLSFFDQKMNKQVQQRLVLEESLRHGLSNNEIVLLYQPKLSLESGRTAGMEVLIRWHRNCQGVVSPNDFIPIAEETGLILPLGEYVLRQASQIASRAVEAGYLEHKIAVNISPRQFIQSDLLDKIKLILDETGLDPKYLQLEITEAAVMLDPDHAIKLMNEFKDCGISLAMDDFGTGYSCLSYLKQFPIDTLKVDMSFVRGMEDSSENKKIVHTVIELAHNLNLEAVAEGVENNEQLEILKNMGCDVIQGYLYSKPITQEETNNFLRRDSLWQFH